MGPQIRLIQSNDTMMAEKIPDNHRQHHPLVEKPDGPGPGHRPQPAGHAGRARRHRRHQRAAAQKNAATLKQGTIDIAKGTTSERGIVDIETLRQTNKQLIETLDELNKIRAEGKVKRANAEQELGRIEGELRSKLLEINASKDPTRKAPSQGEPLTNGIL